MRIEKRLPFGFRGDWGKLYKRYTAEKEIKLKEDDIVKYEENFYVDIGEDVQFKRTSDITVDSSKTLKGSILPVEYVTVETTDSYFDDSKSSYECVISKSDVVKVLGRVWMVTAINTKTKYTPNPQNFYYCDLMRIK